MSAPKLTLEAGHWYAMTMYPGYGDYPYRSPVHVQRITPMGNRVFELDFINAGYAQGVQNMTKQFRTLYRQPGSIVSREVQQNDRTVIFEDLSIEWIAAYVPAFGAVLLDTLRKQGAH